MKGNTSYTSSLVKSVALLYASIVKRVVVFFDPTSITVIEDDGFETVRENAELHKAALKSK